MHHLSLEIWFVLGTNEKEDFLKSSSPLPLAQQSPWPEDVCECHTQVFNTVTEIRELKEKVMEKVGKKSRDEQYESWRRQTDLNRFLLAQLTSTKTDGYVSSIQVSLFSYALSIIYFISNNHAP